MTTFTLPFPPSVNNLFANGKNGRFRTQRYDQWIHEAGAEIMRQRPSKVAGPVILVFEFGNPDKRKRDISNLIKAPEDLLVKHGIIQADDDTIVQEIRAKWNPEIEGVKVTVSSFFVASAYQTNSTQGQRNAAPIQHGHQAINPAPDLHRLRSRG